MMRSGDRSPTSSSVEDEDGPAGDKRLFCYCWWRSAPEFDEHGHPSAGIYPTTAGGVAALPSRARVLKEMERLALVAHESLEDLRHKLHSYVAGDLWVPTGGLTKQETDIPPAITILLVGFAGSGKSSLVNLMYSVLGRAGIIPFAHTSSSGEAGRTRRLEEHNVLRSPRTGFCVFDTRGLDYDRVDEGLEEVTEWMHSGVRHRQICGGVEDDGLESESRRYARRKVNCVVVVANLSEIYRSYKADDLKPLESTRQLFQSPSLRICNENPILILTHGDQLTTEERLEGRLVVCERLGVSETMGAYDVACLNEHGLLVDEQDPVTAYSVTEAVYRALLLSDRTHPPKKGVMDKVVDAVYWAMWCISAFLAFLSRCFSRWANRGPHKLKLV